MRRSLESSARLRSLQAWFFAQLQPGARLEAGPVLGTADLGARPRIAIYADMYRTRLVEALAAEYPRLSSALGREGFRRLALDYLKHFPSRQPTIQDAGDRLPRYLAGRLRAGRLTGFPYAADLARLERLSSQLYVSAPSEETALTAAHLREVPPQAWPSLRFRVIDSLRTLRLGFRFRKRLAPLRATTVYRVYRRGLEVYEAPMDLAEARALRLVARGSRFAEVCAVLDDAVIADLVVRVGQTVADKIGHDRLQRAGFERR